MMGNTSMPAQKTHKTATLHWLMQRMTALALIPLTLPLLVFLDLCITAPYQQTVAWLQAPLNRLCIGIWVLAVFYHAAMGLQVVIEDYIAKRDLQVMLIKAINISFIVLMVVALFFMFRI
jgi:succinate dehydrogenase / fumarate reductase, membrane anchor subunit